MDTFSQTKSKCNKSFNQQVTIYDFLSIPEMESAEISTTKFEFRFSYAMNTERMHFSARPTGSQMRPSQLEVSVAVAGRPLGSGCRPT